MSKKAAPKALTALEVMQGFDALKAKQEISPYYVWTALWDEPRKIEIFNDQLYIGGAESNYVDLAKARRALDWLANQLGGTIKWKGTDGK